LTAYILIMNVEIYFVQSKLMTKSNGMIILLRSNQVVVLSRTN